MEPEIDLDRARELLKSRQNAERLAGFQRLKEILLNPKIPPEILKEIALLAVNGIPTAREWEQPHWVKIFQEVADHVGNAPLSPNTDWNFLEFMGSQSLDFGGRSRLVPLGTKILVKLTRSKETPPKNQQAAIEILLGAIETAYEARDNKTLKSLLASVRSVVPYMEESMIPRLQEISFDLSASDGKLVRAGSVKLIAVLLKALPEKERSSAIQIIIDMLDDDSPYVLSCIYTMLPRSLKMQQTSLIPSQRSTVAQSLLNALQHRSLDFRGEASLITCVGELALFSGQLRIFSLDQINILKTHLFSILEDGQMDDIVRAPALTVLRDFQQAELIHVDDEFLRVLPPILDNTKTKTMLRAAGIKTLLAIATANDTPRSREALSYITGFVKQLLFEKSLGGADGAIVIKAAALVVYRESAMEKPAIEIARVLNRFAELLEDEHLSGDARSATANALGFMLKQTVLPLDEDFITRILHGFMTILRASRQEVKTVGATIKALSTIFWRGGMINPHDAVEIASVITQSLKTDILMHTAAAAGIHLLVETCLHTGVPLPSSLLEEIPQVLMDMLSRRGLDGMTLSAIVKGIYKLLAKGKIQTLPGGTAGFVETLAKILKKPQAEERAKPSIIKSLKMVMTMRASDIPAETTRAIVGIFLEIFRDTHLLGTTRGAAIAGLWQLDRSVKALTDPQRTQFAQDLLRTFREEELKCDGQSAVIHGLVKYSLAGYLSNDDQSDLLSRFIDFLHHPRLEGKIRSALTLGATKLYQARLGESTEKPPPEMILVLLASAREPNLDGNALASTLKALRDLVAPGPQLQEYVALLLEIINRDDVEMIGLSTAALAIVEIGDEQGSDTLEIDWNMVLDRFISLLETPERLQFAVGSILKLVARVWKGNFAQVSPDIASRILACAMNLLDEGKVAVAETMSTVSGIRSVLYDTGLIFSSGKQELLKTKLLALLNHSWRQPTGLASLLFTLSQLMNDPRITFARVEIEIIVGAVSKILREQAGAPILFNAATKVLRLLTGKFPDMVSDHTWDDLKNTTLALCCSADINLASMKVALKALGAACFGKRAKLNPEEIIQLKRILLPCARDSRPNTPWEAAHVFLLKGAKLIPGSLSPEEIETLRVASRRNLENPDLSPRGRILLVTHFGRLLLTDRHVTPEDFQVIGRQFLSAFQIEKIPQGQLGSLLHVFMALLQRRHLAYTEEEMVTIKSRILKFLGEEKLLTGIAGSAIARVIVSLYFFHKRLFEGSEISRIIQIFIVCIREFKISFKTQQTIVHGLVLIALKSDLTSMEEKNAVRSLLFEMLGRVTLPSSVKQGVVVNLGKMVIRSGLAFSREECRHLRTSLLEIVRSSIPKDIAKASAINTISHILSLPEVEPRGGFIEEFATTMVDFAISETVPVRIKATAVIAIAELIADKRLVTVPFSPAQLAGIKSFLVTAVTDKSMSDIVKGSIWKSLSIFITRHVVDFSPDEMMPIMTLYQMAIEDMNVVRATPGVIRAYHRLAVRPSLRVDLNRYAKVLQNIAMDTTVQPLTRSTAIKALVNLAITHGQHADPGEISLLLVSIAQAREQNPAILATALKGLRVMATNPRGGFPFEELIKLTTASLGSAKSRQDLIGGCIAIIIDVAEVSPVSLESHALSIAKILQDTIPDGTITLRPTLLKKFAARLHNAISQASYPSAEHLLETLLLLSGERRGIGLPPSFWNRYEEMHPKPVNPRRLKFLLETVVPTWKSNLAKGESLSETFKHARIRQEHDYDHDILWVKLPGESGVKEFRIGRSAEISSHLDEDLRFSFEQWLALKHGESVAKPDQ